MADVEIGRLMMNCLYSIAGLAFGFLLAFGWRT